MSVNIVLAQALAELAYTIALSDGEIEEKEKKAFDIIIETELGKSAWSAKNRFAILEERIAPNIDQAYKLAIFAIKMHKKDFTEDLKQKFINVLEKLAFAVNGLGSEEKKLIAKIKKDIAEI